MSDASSGALVEGYDEFRASRDVGASGCARLRAARWRRSWQPETSPPAHLGRSSADVSRKRVGRIAEAKSCGVTRSTVESPNRSWTVPQVCAEAHASSNRGRPKRRFPDFKSSGLPWFTASCCSGGLLAVIQSLLCPTNF